MYFNFHMRLSVYRYGEPFGVRFHRIVFQHSVAHFSDETVVDSDSTPIVSSLETLMTQSSR